VETRNKPPGLNVEVVLDATTLRLGDAGHERAATDKLAGDVHKLRGLRVKKL
jgi:hypothetical protein